MDEEVASEFNAYFKDFVLYIDSFKIPLKGEFEYSVYIPELTNSDGTYSLGTTETVKSIEIGFDFIVPDMSIDLHYPFYFLILIMVLQLLRVVKLWIF